MISLKRCFQYLPVLILSYSLHAQAPSCAWVQSIKGIASGRGIAIDSSGNSYVTGEFSDNATIGRMQLNSAGSTDIFIVKYDAAGNAIWARSAGGTGEEYAGSIGIDAAGNCYVTGAFSEYGAVFGSIVVSSVGSNDGFLAKYTSNGECVWVKNVGGKMTDYGSGVTLDAKGFIYMAGSFEDTASFGTQRPLVSNGGRDVFVAKFTSNGSCIDASQGGGSQDEYCRGASLDALGNIYLTGDFSRKSSFGSSVLNSDLYDEMFIAKFDANGQPVWASQAKGTDGYDWGFGISTDTAGNSTVTGEIESAAVFDPFQLGSAHSVRAFIAKYDTKGACLWASATGGPGMAIGAGVKVDGKGNSFVTGRYTGQITFGTETISAIDGIWNVYAGKFDLNGKCLWAKSVCQSDTWDACAIAIDAKGDLWVTGRYYGDRLFDGIPLTGSGVFIAKFADGVLGVERPIKIPAGVPAAFELLQNYPNPFNPSTTISFSLPSRSFVTMRIFDVMGKEEAIIVSEELSAGKYSRQWNAGSRPSGMYFYRLQAGSFAETKKLLLVR